MKKVFAREDLCINCRLCEVYCKTAHSVSKDIVTAYKEEDPAPVARITVLGGREDSVAVNCRHCEDPACVKACITGAMQKDKKTGIVSVDESKCIGCMTCLAVCPNRALVWAEAGGEQYHDKIKAQGDSYKRLIFEGDKLVGYVLINASDNAGIYTNIIANGVSLDTLAGNIMDTPSLFLFNRETRTDKLTGGVAL